MVEVENDSDKNAGFRGRGRFVILIKQYILFNKFDVMKRLVSNRISYCIQINV
jgi:hypothetical protein